MAATTTPASMADTHQTWALATLVSPVLALKEWLSSSRLRIQNTTTARAAPMKKGMRQPQWSRVSSLIVCCSTTSTSWASRLPAIALTEKVKPNAPQLGLDKIGLELNKRGQIETDHDFRSKVDGVWAIGDVIPGPMLAHKAEDEGIAVAENIAGKIGIVNHAVIPSVVYTMPEIAGVGLTEEEAKANGEVKIGKFPMLANSRAKTNHEPDGFVKVIADAKTDRVLGVWCIASVAGTMIAQAAQAMEFGATSEDIAYTCHAHPTHSEALKEAAMAVTGKPIHI